jgi:hypothetical protein
MARFLDRIGPMQTSYKFKKMIYSAGAKGLRVIDLENLKDQKLEDGDFGYRRNVTVMSPDGRKVAFALDNINIVNLNGSNLKSIPVSENCSKIDQIEWSPDNRYLGYRARIDQYVDPPNSPRPHDGESMWNVHSQRAEVHIVDASTMRDRIIVNNGSFGGWSRTGTYFAYINFDEDTANRRFNSDGIIHISDSLEKKGVFIGRGVFIADTWN